MRKILFRGKRTDNGRWAYGNLLTMFVDDVEQFCICGRDFDYLRSDKSFTPRNCYRVHENTICEYTGLNDKHQRPVFEGDLVKTADGYIGTVAHGWFRPYHGEVTEQFGYGYYIAWSNNKYLRQDISFWVASEKIEVTGNLFDAENGGEQN